MYRGHDRGFISEGKGVDSMKTKGVEDVVKNEECIVIFIRWIIVFFLTNFYRQKDCYNIPKKKKIPFLP